MTSGVNHIAGMSRTSQDRDAGRPNIRRRAPRCASLTCTGWRRKERPARDVSSPDGQLALRERTQLFGMHPLIYTDVLSFVCRQTALEDPVTAAPGIA